MVHLGRNPITSQGWEFFKNCFTDESTIGGEATLTHLSVNMLTESGSPASGSVKYIHTQGMDHLSQVLPLLEEADLSGQSEVGTEGWIYLAEGLKAAHEKNKPIKLRTLKLEGCKIKDDVKQMLEDTAAKTQPNLRIDFGPIDVADAAKKRAFCC